MRFILMMTLLLSGCSKFGPECKQLLDCCEALPEAVHRDGCLAALDEARAAEGAEAYCGSAAETLVATGQCSGEPGLGGRDASVGPTDASAPDARPDQGRPDASLVVHPDGGDLDSVCRTYISCVAQTAPAGLGVVIAAYGNDGSCWGEGDASLCEAACRAGTVAAHRAYPDAEACNLCQRSEDCIPRLPACEAEAGRCVECLADADCPGTKPSCDATSRRCVACTTDAHCTDGWRPRCDVSAAECVACLDDEDCPTFTEPVCDPVVRQCRGCTSDSECGSGVCSNGTCRACRTDADCGSSSPFCHSSGACVQCLEAGDCDPGICLPLSRTCCGVSACADQAAECGRVVDAQCPFLPISCGGCGMGEVCLGNACTPSPTLTCSGLSCPSGRCGYLPEDNRYACLGPEPQCSAADRSCGPGYTCRVWRSETTGDSVYLCRQYCLADADCPVSGGTCLIDTQTGVGTCQ